jgi:hypothetical protein
MVSKKAKKKPENAAEGLENIVKAGGVAMGVIEEVLKNKEELLVALMKVLEGKESRARVNLDGVKFNIGKSSVKMEGEIEFTFVPLEDKKR